MKLFELFQELHEDRIDFVRRQAKKLGKILLWLLENEPTKVPENYTNELQQRMQGNTNPESWGNALIDIFAKYDPTPDKRYVQWMAQTFRRGGLKLEDLYKLPRYLEDFELVKRQLPAEKRDIRIYKSPSDLYINIKDVKPEESSRSMDKKLDQKMHQQADIIYNGSDYKIVVPKTKEASCYFGRNTEWCTAATKSNNFFEEYNSKGPLYIIIDKKNNRRWQLHFETQAIMDENDSPVFVQKFIAEHPKVNDIFRKHLQKYVVGHVDDLVVLETETLVVATKEVNLATLLPPRGNLVALKNRQGIVKDAYVDMSTEKLQQVLNLTKNTHGNADEFIQAGIYYNNGKYGSFYEISDVYLDLDDYVWKWLKPDNKSVPNFQYRLYKKGKEQPVVNVEEFPTYNARVARIYYGMSQTMVHKKYYPHIVEWLKSSRVEQIAASSPFQIHMLPNKLLHEILQAKPELATPHSSYKTEGLTSRTKYMIEEKLDEEDIPFVKWAGDKLIVERFRSLSELLNKYGDRDVLEAENILYNPNKEFNNLPSTVSPEILLGYLPKKVLLDIGNYMQNKYADVIDEYNLPFKAGHIGDILDLQDIIQDDILGEAIEESFKEGVRVGCLKASYEALKRVIDEEPIFIVKGTKLIKEVELRSPAVIALSVEQVLDMLLPTPLRRLNWFGTKDGKIELRTNSHKLIRFDRKTAVEVFTTFWSTQK